MVSPSLRPTKENDSFLTPAFVQYGYKNKQLERLNSCRKYLQVVLLSATSPLQMGKEFSPTSNLDVNIQLRPPHIDGLTKFHRTRKLGNCGDKHSAKSTNKMGKSSRSIYNINLIAIASEDIPVVS